MGGADHNDVHIHTAILSHLSSLSPLHTHLQVGLKAAHTGILHLFQSTRGLVGSHGSDRGQGQIKGGQNLVT